MKKIYESPLNSWNEYGERVHVYALESDEEYWEVHEVMHEMTHEGKCEYFGVTELTGWAVGPGCMGYTYSFELSGHHVIMFEHLTMNV